jgi:large subunit ribosomal protein L31e
MAEKKVVSEEKIFTIPLRDAWMKSPRIQKANRSVSAVKAYVKKHTRATGVTVSQKLNDVIWGGGAKKPPHRIMVKVSVSEGVANVRLPEEITLEEEKKKFLEKKKEAEKAPAAEDKETAPAEEPKAEEKPEAGKKEEKAPEAAKAEEKA